MQFLPWAMFSQNSSRFLACGNCPAMPITAMGGDEGPAAGTPVNRDAVGLRQEISSSAPSVAILSGDELLFPVATSISPAGAAPGLAGLRCFSASSLT